MKVYHQTGFRYNWNIDSFTKDNAGDGLIFSPVNIESDKIELKISPSIKMKSLFDPQFYMINDNKGKLATYDFFPANIKANFNTNDLFKQSKDIAKECLNFQGNNSFEYLIIPARYFDEMPSKYFDQYFDFIVKPFTDFYRKTKFEQVLLTIILKQSHLIEEGYRNNILNWITSIQNIDGIYLIFENHYDSKQIKDSQYLFNALLFIHYLRLNNLEVHIGYTNTEGLLYSIADPTSISMGSYENLRKFNIKRFKTEPKRVQQSPNARLYVGNLFQWIDYNYVQSIKNEYEKWNDIFEDSQYKPLMFKQTFNWHLQKFEPYKHFFIIFYNQVVSLASRIDERISFLQNSFEFARKTFSEIIDSGVALDSNSDGSHLVEWLKTIKLYNDYKDKNPDEF